VGISRAQDATSEPNYEGRANQRSSHVRHDVIPPDLTHPKCELPRPRVFSIAARK